MDFPMLSPHEMPVALRAWATVAQADGAMTQAERHLLEVIAEIHGTKIDAARLDAIEPREVAETVNDPHRAKRVVQLAMVVAMADGNVTEARASAVRSLAEALGIDERGLRVLHEIAHGHRLLARVDMTRRIVGRLGGSVLEDEGLAGVGRMVGPAIFGTEDKELGDRYRALERLPRGTFGRAYFEWARERGFALPGEKGGFPERGLFHELGHVLAGYGTDPQGEIQQGAFQAGFVRTDGFMFLMFVIMHFHLGLRITPIAKAETGLFDIDLVMRALARGSRCKVDLSDHWNMWRYVAKPLDQVRAELGIEPIESTAARAAHV
jgi:tellurite resistance protein